MTVLKGTLNVRNWNMSTGGNWEAASTAIPVTMGAATVVTVSTVQGIVTERPESTAWAKQAGLNVNSSNELLTVGGGGGAGSTTVNVSSAAGRHQVDPFSSNATQFYGVRMSDGSTYVTDSTQRSMRVTAFAVDSTGNIVGSTFALSVISSAVPTATSSGVSIRYLGEPSGGTSTSVTATPAAGSTFSVRPLQSSAADLQVTVTPVAGSTFNVRPLQSSAADLAMTATIGQNLQSTVWPSTNSSGVIVRWPDLNSTTYGQTTAFNNSTVITLASSAAASKGYVYAYSVTSTLAGPVTVGFYKGSSLVWPVQFAAPSSAISGANLAVSPPAYLFRGDTGLPLTINVATSNAGMNVAVAFWVMA